MGDMIELDVRGLSCPEPVIMTMDAMEANPGMRIRVIADEAHTRKNLEKMFKYQGKKSTTEEKNGEYIITVEA